MQPLILRLQCPSLTVNGKTRCIDSALVINMLPSDNDSLLEVDVTHESQLKTSDQTLTQRSCWTVVKSRDYGQRMSSAVEIRKSHGNA